MRCLFGFLCVCALGEVPLVGCTETTGGGGTGGVGGSVADACTTAENLEVYENLTYTNDIGDTFTGTDAASEIGSDCIFGSGPAQASLADPQLDGCAVEATRLLTCLPSSCADCTAPDPPATCGQACTAIDECGDGFTCFDGTCTDAVLAAAACVVGCTQDATAAASPPGLSDECVSCTGTSVTCVLVYCWEECITGTDAPQCIACRCREDCIQSFDICSGLPSGDECE